MMQLLACLRILLDKHGQKQYLLLAILSVLSSLFQTAGVAAISLFFTILLGGILPAKVQGVVDGLSFPTLGGLVLLLMLLGTGSSAFTTYYGIKLSWSQYQTIASRLLDRYLRNSYEWHLGQNSASLSKAVITEAYSIVVHVLQQLVMILVRGSEILLIGALLVVARPLIALVASLSFFLIYGGLYCVSRSFIRSQGESVAQANTDRQRAVNEALSGIKATKVAQLEPYFLGIFRNAAKSLGSGTANIHYFSLLPKYLIELLLFGGLVAFVVLSHQRGWNSNESIPLLALYGAAAIRLLPAVQQLYSSLAMIVGSQASLLHVLDGLRVPPSNPGLPPAPQRLSTESLIAFRNVSYRYAGSSLPSLLSLDLNIERGEKVGIVGATGAGKTTLVDLLLNLLQPTEGEIARAPRDSQQTLIAYVPQQLHFIDDTIAANIALGEDRAERDQERIRDAARRSRIQEHIETLPQGYDTPMGEQGVRLSGGQRQRIGIARALYQRPALLVLDEASNALDAETERQVVSSLLEQDLTVLIIAHRISILQGCSRILVLEHGRLVAEGSFDELQQKSSRFRALASADAGQEAAL
jgi:ABC-type multidrug transport system fused ATPase/permease subunit